MQIGKRFGTGELFSCQYLASCVRYGSGTGVAPPNLAIARNRAFKYHELKYE
jgi:hypothetical protein